MEQEETAPEGHPTGVRTERAPVEVSGSTNPFRPRIWGMGQEKRKKKEWPQTNLSSLKGKTAEKTNQSQNKKGTTHLRAF